MGAGCHSYKWGLTAQHAYTLIGAYVLNGHKVVKMRNPWSSEKYKGPWSDNDSRWTRSLRRQVNSKIANDGVFFFPFEAFQSVFTSINLAFYNDNWKQVSIKNNGRHALH